MKSSALLGILGIAAGSWVLATAMSFAPLEVGQTEMDEIRHLLPDPELLATYQSCSRSAEDRVLSPAEARHCSEIYLRLKLSFLPNVNPDVFQSLSVKERWEIQQRGYDALRAWRESRGRKWSAAIG